MRTNVEELGKNLQPDGKFNILARRLRLRCELALKASPAKHCLWSWWHGGDGESARLCTRLLMSLPSSRRGNLWTDNYRFDVKCSLAGDQTMTMQSGSCKACSMIARCVSRYFQSFIAMFVPHLSSLLLFCVDWRFIAEFKDSDHCWWHELLHREHSLAESRVAGHRSSEESRRGWVRESGGAGPGAARLDWGPGDGRQDGSDGVGETSRVPEANRSEHG